MIKPSQTVFRFYKKAALARLQGTTKNLMGLLKHHQGERPKGNDVLQMDCALYAVELVFTFARLMVQLRH